MMAPTPQSLTAEGRKASRPPSFSQSIGMSRPSSQPMLSSSASTWTTSQGTAPPSTLARSAPMPPSQESSTRGVPVSASNGSK